MDADTQRLELWEKLRALLDAERLRMFADSYPGSIESYQARDLAAAVDARGRIKKQHGWRAGRAFEEIKASVSEQLSAIRQSIEADKQMGAPKNDASDEELLESLEKRIESVRGPRWRIHSLDGWDLYAIALREFLDRWPEYPEAPDIEKEIRRVEDLLQDVARGLGELEAYVAPLAEKRDQLEEEIRLKEEALERAKNETALAAIVAAKEAERAAEAELQRHLDEVETPRAEREAAQNRSVWISAVLVGVLVWALSVEGTVQGDWNWLIHLASCVLMSALGLWVYSVPVLLLVVVIFGPKASRRQYYMTYFGILGALAAAIGGLVVWSRLTYG